VVLGRMLVDTGRMGSRAEQSTGKEGVASSVDDGREECCCSELRKRERKEVVGGGALLLGRKEIVVRRMATEAPVGQGGGKTSSD